MVEKTNFGDLPEEYSNVDKASVVILPVPFDKTSTWKKGADRGPDAIFHASANMELYDIATDSEVYTKGIATLDPIVADSTTETFKAVHAEASKYIAAGKFVVTLGGEHSISAGTIKAHADVYGADKSKFSVLQLDAHSDMRDEYHGDKLNHACVMARALDYTPNIVSVGVRSMDVSEKANVSKGKYIFGHELPTRENWQDEVVDSLKENVYLTLDLDVFDSSIMPSTGTPEPGGMDWWQVASLLQKVCVKRNLVGFDVVELCPNPQNAAPDFLAAKLVYSILTWRAKG